MIRPWYTVAQLSATIKEEVPDVKSVNVCRVESHRESTAENGPLGQEAQWTNGTTLRDVFRAAFRTISANALQGQTSERGYQKGFILRIDDQSIPVMMPTFKGSAL